MGILDALALGALQGVTEFLPISSSGHLVICEDLLGLEVEVLKSFDVSVHMGTLAAVLVYFWKDFREMIMVFFGFLTGRRYEEEYKKLILYIIIGTIPAVFAGIYLEKWIDMTFRSVWMVSLMMILLGVIFFAGEFIGEKIRKSKLKWWKALIIGAAQAVALIPGISRSGSTIVTGLFTGLSREQAARFSFLLGAPAMLGAGIWTSMKGFSNFDVVPTIAGFFISFVVGLIAVFGLMKFLKNHSLSWFGAYLIIFGGIFLIFQYN